MVVNFSMRVTWAWWRDALSGYFVATCDDLKLTAEAITFGELAETIMESQLSFFNYLNREGRLEDFLDERSVEYETDGGTADVNFPMPNLDYDPNHEAHCQAS